MAILAPLDWQQTSLPKDKAMEVPTNSKQQRSSPANENQNHVPQQQGQQLQQQQHPAHHQPSFTYPIQQQAQGNWTPSINAAPFYPSFYQNQQHHSPQGYPQQMPQHHGYFDQTANAQLAAQWAYQQMMFNAQHSFPQQPQRSASADFYAQNQINPAFAGPFPSGTPPPRSNSVDMQQQTGQPNQFGGFHPYRRPNKTNQQTQPHSQENDRRPSTTLPPQPPYKRPDASGSSSSVNSNHSQRQRTTSMQSGASGHTSPSSAAGSVRGRNHPPSTSIPSRNTPSPASSNGSTAAGQLRVPHHRNSSSSSTNSSRPSGVSPPPASSSTTSSSPTASSSNTPLAAPIPRPARPSPLSQGNFTASERRMSRDDSMLDSNPAAAARSNGLKGRLRRALSFNPTLKEDEASDDESIKASNLNASGKQKSKSSTTNTTGKSNGTNGTSDGVAGDDSASTATVQTKKSRAASLFNRRLNASTDNISLSSTVSSASVMIRKLGSMGKLARRNSLAGITSLFKDKDKSKKKDKKGGKAEASEASISHVTAELDRTSGDWNSPEMNGLSPAAKLARQHTLKTNAEAAARAKAQQEAAAKAVAEASANAAPAGVPAWDKDTAKRQATSPVNRGTMRVQEDGSRVLVEDDDEDSDDGHRPSQQAGQNHRQEGWGEEDDDWELGDEDDEDTTIRLGIGRASLEDNEDDVEPWALNVRRSEERVRQPAKGILKNADSYDQQTFLNDGTQNRVRSNSYTAPGHTELGPLAHIPSDGPDQIDGIHKPIPTLDGIPSLPPLSFDNSPTSMSFDKEPTTPTNAHSPHLPEKPSPMFHHANSSAPALSKMTAPLMLTHRSATAPASKRLTFANNLSVYDTFPASVYDRRSEPATWSRLTPALAQRIKEELNSYKMEEMEVHAASRIHTQFFV